MSALIFGILVGVGAVSLVCLLVLSEERILKLEQRVGLLEATARKRMPQNAQEELLDAMAALDRLTMDVEVMTAIKENARCHIANALAIGTKRESK